eukprot:GHVL01020690.1.p1 GENE.GHVL01020690.1~~GHVL01020690.1.p1  ORF type:complete len:220 (-),score=19.60 GHVL01020690.1:149-808(-)
MFQYYAKHAIHSDNVLIFSPTLFPLCALISIPVWLYLIRKWLDKKIVFIICLSIMSVTYMAIAIFVDIGDTTLFFSLAVITSAGLGGFLFAPTALRNDITDYDELIYGYRREGVYVGWWQLCSRVCAAFTIFITLNILNSADYRPRAPWQSTSTQAVIRILYGGVVSFLYLAALLIMLWYPITRPIHHKIVKAAKIRTKGDVVENPLRPNEMLPGFIQS